MYGWKDRLLMVDLAEKKVSVQATGISVCKEHQGMETVAGKYLDDENIVIMTGPLTGLFGPCTNRYGVYVKADGKITGGSIGGFFGAELKLCGYDGMVIRGAAKEPVCIVIKDDEVEFLSAASIKGEDVDAKTAALMEKFPVKSGTLVIGTAAENGCEFAAVMGDRLYSGAAGTGVVFAEKNLLGIAASGTGVLEIAEPKQYGEIALKAREKVAASKFAIALGSTDAKVSYAAAVNLQKRPLAGYKNIERSLDWKTWESFSVTGRRGCYSCTIGCRKQYRITEGRYKGVVEAPAPEAAQVFEEECQVKDINALLAAYELCRRNGMDPVMCSAFAGSELTKEGKAGDAEEMLRLVEKAVASGKNTACTAPSGYEFAAVKNRELNAFAVDCGICPFAAAMLTAEEIKSLVKAAEGRECEVNG